MALNHLGDVGIDRNSLYRTMVPRGVIRERNVLVWDPSDGDLRNRL
jgi:hypothetical protein